MARNRNDLMAPSFQNQDNSRSAAPSKKKNNKKSAPAISAPARSDIPADPRFDLATPTFRNQDNSRTAPPLWGPRLLPAPPAPPPPPAPPAAPAPPGGGPNEGGPNEGSTNFDDMLQKALDTMGPGPNEGDYTKPYDEAMGKAHDAYNAGLPVIAKAYADLADKLNASRAAGAADSQRLLQQSQAQQGQVQGQLASLNAQTLADIQRQGGAIQQGAPTAAAQAMAQASQGGLVAQGAAQNGYLNNLQAARDASLADRVSSGDAAKANAQANAANNLDAVLNQLGIQKAGAQRQYQGDVASYARQQAQTRLGFLQQAMSQDAQDFKQRQGIAQDVTKAHTQAMVPAGQTWQRNNLPQIAAQYPKTTKAFNAITSQASGKGGVGLAQARTALAEGKANPQQFAKTYGFVPNEGTWNYLDGMLKNFYDETPTLDDSAFNQALGLMGIDPKSLPKP